MSRTRMIAAAQQMRETAGSQALGVDVRSWVYHCRECGAGVTLTVRDPLPPGWRVVLERGRRTSRWTSEADVRASYVCPTCAGGGV